MRRTEAQRVIRSHASAGRVVFSQHAQARLKERGITIAEATDALSSGPLPVEQPANGRWLCRSNIHAEHVTLIVVIEDSLIVVTVWRKEDEKR